MGLEEYKRKRDFSKTSEPQGGHGGREPIFVVQKHAARNLHYDLRLETDDVLRSWAVPKGPSLNPSDKRLAVLTEDHPIDYANFEGKIPEGEYGAGSVIIWDKGTYENVSVKDRKEIDFSTAFEMGHISFILHGQKLKGEFALVKMKNRGEKNWLLIKANDRYASSDDVLEDMPKSIISNKGVDDI